MSAIAAVAETAKTTIKTTKNEEQLVCSAYNGT